MAVIMGAIEGKVFVQLANGPLTEVGTISLPVEFVRQDLKSYPVGGTEEGGEYHGRS